MALTVCTIECENGHIHSGRDVEREKHAEALHARLTHAEREVLRPVLARYAKWPDAHDGPVFEAIEGVLAGRRGDGPEYSDPYAGREGSADWYEDS